MPTAPTAKQASRPKAPKPTPAPAPESAATVIPFPLQASHPGVLLQRKCACGGSCPRCRDDTLRKLQPKLRVGPVDDPYEREADRIAHNVLGSQGEQPQPAAPARNDHQGSKQQAPTPEPSATQLTTGGAPLAPTLRAFFESRMGRDLSAVRIHAGQEAEGATDHFDAHAFTLGHHVWLGRGQQPAPNFLLAHELAHVVQQRQPQTVQRLGRALFWVPLDAAGAMTGTDIHKELIDEAVGKNKQLDNEAPAPNGDANGWGLGHQGRIDIYRGKRGTKFHVMPGVTWAPGQNIPVGSRTDDPIWAIPREHFQAKFKDAKGTIAPRMDGVRVVDIDKGPTDVAVGELKPASAEILGKGEGQLTNYREGIAHSARLANAWAQSTTATNKTAPQWKLNTPANLAETDVKFKPEHEFDPNNLKGNYNLVLGRVSEGSGAFGQKYSVRFEYIPAKHKLPPIKGGLYAMPAGKPGLWTYFARPQNLDDALARARGNVNLQGNMVLANRIQDEVIVPLLKAPEKVTKFSRQRGLAPDATQVRLKTRHSPKLQDKFPLAKWQKSQSDLRGEANPKTEPAKTKLESLEFLHKAYEAEEALDAIPGGVAGKSKLPPKSKDMVKAGSDPKTARSHPLADILQWARGWTGRPAYALGTLRNTFGDSFVFAANKFIEIRDAVRKKVKAFIDKRRKSLGTSTAHLVLGAIFRAVKALMQVTLHQAAHYIVNKVEAGSKRKLKEWFDFDPVKLLEDTLEQTFNSYLKPLADLKARVQGFFDETVKSITDNFSWIEDLQKVTDKVGPIIEAAVIALQCLTPPGWGCLKMLLRKLQTWAIEKVLGWCDVKEAIAAVVAKVPFISNLGQWLGDKALGLMQGVVPDEFKDVFTTDTPVPPREPVACDDDLDPEEAPPSAEQKKGTAGSLETLGEINGMKKEQGEEKTQALSDVVGAAGVPDTTPLTADQVRALRQKMNQVNPTVQELRDLAAGKAADETRTKLAPLKDYLDGIAGKARKDLLDQMVQALKAGKYDKEFKQLAAARRTWLFIKPPPVGAPFTGAEVLMTDGATKAGGLIDGVMGACDKNGEVEVTITRTELRNADKPDETLVIQVPLRGPMEGLCGKPGAKPGGTQPQPLPPVEGAPPPQVAKGPAPAKGGAGVPPTEGGGGGAAGGGGGGTGAGKPAQPAPKGKATVLDAIKEGAQGGAGGAPGGAAAFEGHFDFCANVLQCPASTTQVTFEAEDNPALGLRVVLSNLGALPGKLGSLQRARFAGGVLTTKDLGDGTFEVYMLDVDDKPHLVGKAVKSGEFAGEFEAKSGAILSQFKSAAKKWEKRFNIPASQSRAHKFRF